MYSVMYTYWTIMFIILTLSYVGIHGNVRIIKHVHYCTYIRYVYMTCHIYLDTGIYIIYNEKNKACTLSYV